MTVPRVMRFKRPPLSGFAVWNLRSSRRSELLDRAISILMRARDSWPSDEELVELGEINLEFMGRPQKTIETDCITIQPTMKHARTEKRTPPHRTQESLARSSIGRE